MAKHRRHHRGHFSGNGQVDGAGFYRGDEELGYIHLLIGLWVRMLQVPCRLLFPTIVLICCIGIYSIAGRSFDVIQIGAFGLLGYLFLKLNLEPPPLPLGLVLGGLLESNLRRGLVLSRGDTLSFVADPLTLALLIWSAAILVSAALPNFAHRRSGLLVADD